MNKYHAKKTIVDNITFHSKKEANRYVELKLLEKAKEIRSLTLQFKMPIIINDIKICTYIADFLYRDLKNGELIYEDVKGYRTPIYKLKKKLVEAIYNIKILET